MTKALPTQSDRRLKTPVTGLAYVTACVSWAGVVLHYHLIFGVLALGFAVLTLLMTLGVEESNPS